MNKEIKYRLKRIFLTLLFFIVATILWKDSGYSTSMAIKTYESSRQKVEFVELSDGIKLENAYPVADEVGMSQDGYQFKIVNKNDSTETYEIGFINTLPEEYKQLPFEDIRYQVIKNGEVFINAENLSDATIMFNDEVTTENIYELKLWIDEDASNEIFGKYFSIKMALK